MKIKKCLKSCCFCATLKSGCIFIGSVYAFQGFVYLMVGVVALIVKYTSKSRESFLSGISIFVFIVCGVFHMDIGLWIILDTLKKESLGLKTWAVIIILADILVFILFILLLTDKDTNLTKTIMFFVLYFFVKIYCTMILCSYGVECDKGLEEQDQEADFGDHDPH
jgi:glucan phosphoethanolaminetransferase (alkaline phosphatase superfamily)